jgi:uncharacterized membrane protein (UPF0127 family)
MRRLKASAATAAVLLSVFVSACAAGASDETKVALEPLEIVTDRGVARLKVEIADDDAERARGLMGRPPLPDDRGMLFQFPVEQEQSFWMKNTPSPLDIVYIDAKGRVVSIARHTIPYSEAPIPSYGPAKGVLEIRAGRADELGLEPGDEIRHPFFGNANPN